MTFFSERPETNIFLVEAGGFPCFKEQVSKGVVRQKTQQECKMN